MRICSKNMFQKMRLIKDLFVRTKALPGQEEKEREKEREREGERERGREEVEGRERKRGEESETYTERQN